MRETYFVPQARRRFAAFVSGGLDSTAVIKGIKSQKITITDLKTNKSSEITTNDKGQSEAFELVRNHEYRITYKGTSTFTADTALFKATDPVSSMVNLTSYFKQYFNKLTVTKDVTEDLSEILLDIYRKDGNVVQMKIASGASYVWNSQGAKTYGVRQIPYNFLIDAEGKIVIADIGHFESEQYTIELLFDIITEKFSNFAAYFTEINTNPVNYL